MSYTGGKMAGKKDQTGQRNVNEDQAPKDIKLPGSRKCYDPPAPTFTGVRDSTLSGKSTRLPK